MTEETTNPWTFYGRIATIVAAALAVLGLILTYLIFVAESFAQGGEMDAAGVFYLIMLGVFVVAAIGGPAVWVYGLRQDEAPLWPPLLLFALFVAASGGMLKMFSDAITYGPLF